MSVPAAIANGFPPLPAVSPFPSCPDYQPAAVPLTVEISRAKTLRDHAAQNLADALRNVELATLAAKAAEANYRALLPAA